MREGTSGFWLTEEKNKITIEYTDFGVSEFGGSDFEMTYTIKDENAEKFRNALMQEYSGTLKEMVEAAFGRGFSDWKFRDFCKDHGIIFSSASWSG